MVEVTAGCLGYGIFYHGSHRGDHARRRPGRATPVPHPFLLSTCARGLRGLNKKQKKASRQIVKMHPNHEHLAEEQKGDKVCKPNNPTRPSHGWTCSDKKDAHRIALPPDLDEKVERERARWEAERARAEAEAAAAAEAERARAEAEEARWAEEARAALEGKCVKTLNALITPSLSLGAASAGPVVLAPPPPPDFQMNPPPGEPKDNSDKSNSIGLVGTALAAGKNAVLFVITHPVTPYAVGAATVVGVCYYGYKWFTSGNSESDGKKGEF